jgi:hypothetical protein
MELVICQHYLKAKYIMISFIIYSLCAVSTSLESIKCVVLQTGNWGISEVMLYIYFNVKLSNSNFHVDRKYATSDVLLLFSVHSLHELYKMNA